MIQVSLMGTFNLWCDSGVCTIFLLFSACTHTLKRLSPSPLLIPQFGPQLAITDPWEWATESNALAASFVYTCPQSSEGDVPAAYISQGYEMAQSQVALGGYRLALLLDSIYDAKRTPAAGAAAAHGSLRGASAVAA